MSADPTRLPPRSVGEIVDELRATMSQPVADYLARAYCVQRRLIRGTPKRGHQRLKSAAAADVLRDVALEAIRPVHGRGGEVLIELGNLGAALHVMAGETPP